MNCFQLLWLHSSIIKITGIAEVTDLKPEIFLGIFFAITYIAYTTVNIDHNVSFTIH